MDDAPPATPPDAFQLHLESALQGLRAQLGIVRSCLVLHPSPPIGLLEVRDEAVARFASALDSFERELKVGGGLPSGVKHETSEGSGSRSATLQELPPPTWLAKPNTGTVTLEEIAGPTAREIRKSYHGEDDDDDDMENPEDDHWLQVCPNGAFNPHWVGRRLWDQAVVLLVVLDALIVPFEMAFLEGQAFSLFLDLWPYVLCMFFTVDMVLHFHTAFPAPTGKFGFKPGTLVTDKAEIARRYLHSWDFRLDLLTTIPWFQVTCYIKSVDPNAARVTTPLLTSFCLVRLLRLRKLNIVWGKIEERLASPGLHQVASLLRVLLTMVSICHWNACVWWIMGKPDSMFVRLFSEELEQSWKDMPHWTTLERPAMPGGEPWRWADRSIYDAYVFCCYWTLGVMRTMPAEVQPANTVERLYVMIFMFLAFSLFAITLAQITGAFAKLTERKKAFQEEIMAVHMYLDSIKAPTSLKQDIESYLKHLFDRRMTHAKESALLSLLPRYLSDKVHSARVSQTLANLGSLRGYPAEVMKRICLISEVRTICQGFVLSRRGHRAQGCWVLILGHLEAYLNGTFSQEHVTIVDENCLQEDFGTKSSLTVVALSCSEVLFIPHVKFLKEVDLDGSHPDTHDEVHPVSARRTSAMPLMR